MINRSKIRKRLFVYFVAALFLVLFSFGIYSLVTGLISFGKDEGWDGYTVATDFEKGNGTIDNPYVIQNAEEFLYFKQLLEGKNYESYQDKYYVLGNTIDFNGNAITPIGVLEGEEERYFTGHFNGNGYALTNFKIQTPTIIDKVEYYSLFTKTVNANFTSLGIMNYRIEIEKNDASKVVAPFVGECIGEEGEEEKELASYKNLYLRDFYVDASEVSTDSKVNALVGTVTGKFIIKNIYIKGEINGDSSLLPIHFVNADAKNIGNIYNIIQNVKVLNAEGKALSYDGMDNVYEYHDQAFYFRDEVIADVTMLAFLNDDIGTDCYWTLESDGLVIYPYEKKVQDIPTTSKEFSFSIRPVGAITAHDSGQDGNTFYINDLTADYNYMQGLNYTGVRNTSLPTTVVDYYNSQNLVKVQIIYDGADINNSSRVGALSPVATENGINKFVYYKYYPLERATNGTLLTNSSGNHYIRFELIDNPFSKRPYVSGIEYGFNGWVCNQAVDSTDHLCENSTIYFAKDNYTRYMEIAVDGGSEIVVHLNASWVEADVTTSYSSISDFNSMSMQPMGTVSNYTTETVNGNAYWKQNYTQMTYIDSYVYNDGYMPRYRWYKYNQSGTTYTYITSSRTRCTRGYTCYVYGANTSGIVGGTQYTGGSYTFVPNFTNNGSNTEITVSSYNRNYMNFEIDPNGIFTDTVQVPHYTTTLQENDTVAAYFYKVNNPTTAMINTKEYYQSSGALCTSTSGCTTAYKLVQYDDSVLNRLGHSISKLEVENGEVVDIDKYYYLVTRDTNIFRYTSTTHLVMDELEVNRPFTVTGTTVNGTSTSGILEYSSTSGWFSTTYYDFSAENDIVIENIKIDGPDTGGTNNTALGGNSKTSQVIYANSHNLKIGRNVTSSDDSNYLVAQAVFGGTNNNVDGTFKIIIESGNYYAYHSGPMSGSTNTTLNETTIIGSDYDRIKNVHNKLRFNIGIDGYAGGHNTAGSDSLFASYNIVKSGTLGYNSDGTPSTDNTSGMYIGGRASTCVESLTGAKIEGGNINTVVGGYGYNGSTTTNSTFIGMSGGTVRGIYGGAGHSTTKGNRIINVTGGTVKYSVLGGSDSYSSSDTNDGVVQGSTLVYVGGNATIGDGSTDELNGVESGSVFGAGGGRDPGNNSTTTKGTVYNSHVIINGATIAKSVYGGGNFGSTGTQSNSSASTVIDIFSGTIGSVYGGSKAAGFSKSEYLTQSTVNINVTGGTIGTIYGGSDDKGTVYGTVNIDVKDGTITGNVYGGGRGANTFVDSSVNVTIGATTTNKPTIAGNVYGGSAFGTVNAASVGGTVHGNTNVTVNNGVISGSVFGGAEGSSSNTPYVYGNITVEVNNGSIGKVFGGFDAVGSPSAGDVVYLKGGTIGNAFGGGNNTGQNTTDIRLQGSTITGNLYGGSNVLGAVTTTNVSVTSGSVTDIYGGNNLGGSAATTNVTVSGGTVNGDVYGGGNEAPSTTSNVTITSTVHDVYGGGKQAGLTTSNVHLTSAHAGKVFGGSNVSGNVTTSNVDITSSTLTSAYGGNNQGGETATTNVDITSSTITNVFGGGDNATSGESNVTIHSGTITNVYGGGNEAGLTTSNVTILDGTMTNVFGGSNTSGNVTTSNVIVGDVSKDISIDIQYTKREPGYYPQSDKPTYAVVSVTLTNNTNANIDNWAVDLMVPNSQIFANNSQSNITVSGDNFHVDSTNRYYDNNVLTANGGTYTFEFEVLSDTPLLDFYVTGDVSNQSQGGSTASSNIQITNLYGGNNLGGLTSSANITAGEGSMGNIYGGGNQASVGQTTVILSDITATNIYGGGNEAGVSGNTFLDIDDSTVTNNIYGGGNEGVVEGSTEVFVTDSHIQGSAFAGGNGSTAVVYRDSTITIDGRSEIGTNQSQAPNEGCVFGSGNAASTGLSSVNNSHATVNLVGGKVHGNVYGGPKMAIVYGVTDTNIGMAAVNDNSLKEESIQITGTVFGGGESNASGSSTYDWTFISVTKGITVDIDGTDYLDNGHAFEIHGSIFGSGNASSSSGTSEIYVKNLGTLAAPNKSISIQRANYLEIDASAIELIGTTDRTNEYSDILYSFNIIDKLVIKNNTSLLLHHNANLLKELYSGVDGEDGLEVAEVVIDDDSKTVNQNVDNRIYMLPGQNLNVTINQAATAYGKVTGMTFFGMFLAHEGGGYRYGLYDPGITYGMAGNASLEIVGGSYVIGLHSVGHDITKDGFYTNYVDEVTHNTIRTAYIDPTEIGSTGYRWNIGFEAINYEFTLTASKYSSLGTYELQLADFAQGNVTFNVLGADTSGLNTNISLIDPANVPRIGRTEDQANHVLGLSMKAETQEWTAYGLTKLLSTNGGAAIGTDIYRTDSRQLPPSLMFYLYHAKNISSQENMGKAVVSLEAAVPRNAIESDISYITITVNLVSRQYEDADSYDASITYDKRYEMPSTTLVNITNTSQFSTYYSLIAWSDTFAGVYGNQNTNFHTLVTNRPLPVNTMITMLDYGANPNRPEYYYFRVTQAVYNDSLEQLRLYDEITYPLRNFIKMDSTSSGNTYSDRTSNLLYYDDEAGLVDEEFMFIFDFKECTETGEHLNNTMLFELRNSEERTVYSVLGIREGLMLYNTYDSSNVVLSQTIADSEQYLYYNIPDDMTYTTKIQYDETANRQSVIDTNYESSSMGLNILFLDSDGEPVSSSLLIGTSFIIDNHQYFADGDGVFRIKLAGKVSNLIRNAKLTVNKDLPAGPYKIRYTLFASDDGLHNSNAEASVSQEFNVTVVSADHSIMVTCDDTSKLVDGESVLNMNNSKVNTYTVKYDAQLTNPNFRVEIYKRAVGSVDSTSYVTVPFNQLFKNSLNVASDNEMYISMDGRTQKNFDFQLQDTLISGTYRVVFKLYDGNQLIDDDVQYVIVHKKTE